jgi:RNA polymerase sigma factor (sigma-70 family)
MFGRKTTLTPEAQLLAGLRRGDQSAVRTWFAEYQARLLRLVLSKIDSEKDAEELTQEIFLHCLKHLPLFRGESGIWTWMQSIARHEIADYYRKKYAKKALKLLPLQELVTGQGISEAHETSEKVKHVFNQMTDEARELLMMKYLDGKKVAEIAAEVGRSIKAVESELFRARQEFRRLYELVEAP